MSNFVSYVSGVLELLGPQRRKLPILVAVFFVVSILDLLGIGLVGAYWFYFKLGWDSIHIPFFGDLFIGWAYIPLFILIVMGVFSTSVVDGLDGLAGGLFAIMFGAYSAIALIGGQYDLAIFCAVVAGAMAHFCGLIFRQQDFTWEKLEF